MSVWIALILILFMPILTYVSVFGMHLSDNHARWAEFGSAFAGIYAPIAAVLTLIVLIVQIGLQSRMNNHTFDYGYIQGARADMQFFLERLSAVLGRPATPEATLGELLITGCAYLDNAHLAEEKRMADAVAFNTLHPEVIALWTGFYSVLAGLQVNDYPPYSNNFIGYKQKAIALFSYAGCVALDNLTYMVAKDRLRFKYEFSPALERKNDA